ncbi:hypothetical protein LSH36_127g07034 [Paralvinella palmiformis]|uniref:Uncharacterized protein n=1 Tax=Paralvinella palmiformis TaxID=53620 RepID=A0AAD9JWR6_9ANNE|nr:hypothetical protein LSH36_127g07034 [Paralvinella palmiformis]
MYHKPQLCGPYGVRDYNSEECREHRYVGEGTMSAEGSSQVNYLWHAPEGVPFPRSRSHKVGEVGWGIPTFVDWTTPNSGQQIQLGEFRQLVEDRYTHLYQNAWYPGPGEEFPPESDAALVTNVYKNSGSQSIQDKQNKSSQGSYGYTFICGIILSPSHPLAHSLNHSLAHSLNHSDPDLYMCVCYL